MKRSILLFTAVGGLFYLTLSSYSSGPSSGGANPPNRTGSTTGSPNDCSTGGCHGNNDQATQISFKLRDSATNQILTDHYVGGRTYTVEIHVLSQTAGATKAGFQSSIAHGQNQQAGTMVATSGNHTFTAGTGANQITGIEHTTPNGLAQGGTLFTYKWRSPAAGAAVQIYAIVNAVNGDGLANAADHASTKVINIPRWLLSVSDLSKDIKIVAYPNPATNSFKLKFDDAEKGNYDITVMDMTGRKMHTEILAVNGSQASTTIESSAWSSGLYFAQVMKDGAQRMIAISKQ